MLRDLSGQEPDRSLSPDEAVAHGAALYHGILKKRRNGESASEAAAARVVNVNAHSLGLVTRTVQSDRLLNSILVPRNTALPHTGSQLFRTGHPNQKRLIIRILEGEAPDPASCSVLGKFVMAPLPDGLPVGSPIRLHYTYDESGRIKVQAIVDGPSVKTELRIARRGSIIDTNIEDWAMNLLTAADGDANGDQTPGAR